MFFISCTVFFTILFPCGARHVQKVISKLALSKAFTSLKVYPTVWRAIVPGPCFIFKSPFPRSTPVIFRFGLLTGRNAVLAVCRISVSWQLFRLWAKNIVNLMNKFVTNYMRQTCKNLRNTVPNPRHLYTIDNFLHGRHKPSCKTFPNDLVFCLENNNPRNKLHCSKSSRSFYTNNILSQDAFHTEKCRFDNRRNIHSRVEQRVDKHFP